MQVNYTPQEFGNVGDKLGVTTAAGYYEGTIVEVREKQRTADPSTFCDYIMLETDPYFNNVKDKVYLNCNMMKCLKVRKIGDNV